jgi:hypothetical protein
MAPQGIVSLRPRGCVIMQVMATHWLLVSSPENFEVSRTRGFDIAGMKSRHRKKVETVQTGDTVFFYMVGIKAIGGLAEVTGTHFEDHTHIWDSRKEGEEYPFRFPTKPVVILEKDQFVEVVDLVDALEYPKRWPREHWTLAFQGNVHKLSEDDFQIIKTALENAQKSK